MGLIFTMAMAVVFGGFFSSGFMGFVGGGVVNFMGFDPDGRGGFFSWWCWVSCGRDGGDGCLKERDSEEKINREDRKSVV